MAASEYELCLQVGEQIRQRRVQLKMNQSELAERADVARNTVYRIEAGQARLQDGLFASRSAGAWGYLPTTSLRPDPGAGTR